MKIFRTWLSVFMVASALPAQTSPVTFSPIPPVYQDLYGSLDATLHSFAGQINAGWNQSKSPVAFAAQLATASSNNGSAILAPNYLIAAVGPELNQLQALGVNAVYVTINFPILYPGYFTYARSNLYQSYLSFYQQVASAIRNRGMKMIVGSSAMVTQCGFTAMNVAPYYASLSLSQYQAGRSAQAATIASVIQPAYLSVIEEPDTEAAQTGFGAVGTVFGSTAMLTQILTAVHQTGVAGVSVGAGVGSWVPSYQSWFRSFASAGAQYLDIHVFPVNHAFLTQLPAMADYAASLGKPVATSQCWLAKERDGELTSLTYAQVAARDPFSFWSPLDAEFLQVMAKYANWKHALFIAPFWTPYFYSYLNFDSNISGMAPIQLLTLATNTAAQSMIAGLHTFPALAYSQSISGNVDTLPPSVPAGLSAVANSSTVRLTWMHSSDTTGVAGYLVYRNGVPINTTTVNSFVDSNLKASTAYTYSVAAYDFAVNISAPSVPVVRTTAR